MTVKNEGRRLTASTAASVTIRAKQWRRTIMPPLLPPAGSRCGEPIAGSSKARAPTPATATIATMLAAVAIVVVGGGLSSVPAVAAEVPSAGSVGSAAAAAAAAAGGGGRGSAVTTSPRSVTVPASVAAAARSGGTATGSLGSLEEREASQADTRNANYFSSKPHPEFAAGLVLHWLLWAYSRREVALAFDFVGIAGLLYDGLEL